jgi:arylsulfatase A
MNMRKLIVSVMIMTVAMTAEAKEKPNVILIMADDVGAEGIGSYGNPYISTPNIDRLASGGAMFQNAYATPKCTPTRVMIMSGMYPRRSGFTLLMGGKPENYMRPELKTIGQYFKAAGYETAVAGKWQLAQFEKFPTHVSDHGFDNYCLWKWRYEGVFTGRYHEPQILQDGRSLPVEKKDYGPDIYTDYLIDFMKKNKKDPFFVYFPMALVHAPIHRPPALEELAFSKYPGKGVQRQAVAHMMTYADMLVGRILDAVKEIGQEDNTLVIFTGDNGYVPRVVNYLGDVKVEGGKSGMGESGSRVPLICYWPGKIPVGERQQLISLVDILPTLGAIAGYEVEGKIDGLDLSHHLYGRKGKERDHVIVQHDQHYYARSKQYRLHENGKFYHIPVASNRERYSEERTSPSDHKTGHDLITGPYSNQGIVTGMLDHHLYRGRYQVPAGKQIFKTHVSGPLSVAGGHDIENSAQTSCTLNPSFYRLCNPVQMV